FFIPCFKWNKHYYVQTSCCGKVYELDPEIGKRIARGERVDIAGNDLNDAGYSSQPMPKTCSYCGYSTYEDFQYCPKCGREF
ncbi:MAG: zinc ribbon domain-containing protein, partial [Lachnospiraceae bacterium]|nr:zinc ribbon domain-containing protein [Lachnospiraceae bacterium]